MVLVKKKYTRKQKEILNSSCAKTIKKKHILKQKYGKFPKLYNIVDEKQLGGGKDNLTSGDQIKEKIKTIYKSNTTYKSIKYVRKIDYYTKELNKRRGKFLQIMENIFENKNFLYNITNLQKKINQFVNNINAVSNDSTMAIQYSKQYKEVINYINSFILKNKNSNIIADKTKCINILKKYKPYICILRIYRQIELQFYHLYYQLTKNIIKLIQVDGKFKSRFSPVFNKNISLVMFNQYENLSESSILTENVSSNLTAEREKLESSKDVKETKKNEPKYNERIDAILTKNIEIIEKFLNDYARIFKKVEILGVVPREHYNIIYQKYTSKIFGHLMAKRKIGETFTLKNIYLTYGKLVYKDQEMRNVYTQILGEFNKQWLALNNKNNSKYDNYIDYNSFADNNQLKNIAKSLNDIACIHPEIENFYTSYDMGFISNNHNSTPCNHFLNNMHLLDFPVVIDTYLSLKTGDNEIYNNDSFHPYFIHQIMQHYNRNDDSDNQIYKRFQDNKDDVIKTIANYGKELGKTNEKMSNFHNTILFQVLSVNDNQKKQLINNTNYYDNYIASKMHDYFDFICNSNIKIFNVKETNNIIPKFDDNNNIEVFDAIVNMIYKWMSFVQDELYYMNKVCEYYGSNIIINTLVKKPSNLKDCINSLYDEYTILCVAFYKLIVDNIGITHKIIKYNIDTFVKSFNDILNIKELEKLVDNYLFISDFIIIIKRITEVNNGLIELFKKNNIDSKNPKLLYDTFFAINYKIRGKIFDDIKGGFNYIIPRITMNFDVKNMDVITISGSDKKSNNNLYDWIYEYSLNLNNILHDILTCCRFYAVHNTNIFMKRQYHLLKILLGYHCHIMNYCRNIENTYDTLLSSFPKSDDGNYPYYNIPIVNFIEPKNDIFNKAFSPYDINMMIYQLLDIQFGSHSAINKYNYGVLKGLENVLHKLKTKDLYAMDFDNNEEELLLSIGLKFAVNLAKSSNSYSACRSQLLYLIYNYIYSFLQVLETNYVFNKNFEKYFEDPNTKEAKIMQFIGNHKYDPIKLHKLVKKYEAKPIEKVDSNIKRNISEFMKYIILYDNNSHPKNKYDTYFNDFIEDYDNIKDYDKISNDGDNNKNIIKEMFNLLTGLSMSFNKKVMQLLSLKYYTYYDDTNKNTCNYDIYMIDSVNNFNGEINFLQYKRLIIAYLGAIYYNYMSDQRFLLDDADIIKLTNITSDPATFLMKLNLYSGLPKYPFIYLDANGKYNDLMKIMYLDYGNIDFNNINNRISPINSNSSHVNSIEPWKYGYSIKNILNNTYIYNPANPNDWNIDFSKDWKLDFKKPANITSLLANYQDNIYTGFWNKSIFKGMKIIRQLNYLKEIEDPSLITNFKRKLQIKEPAIKKLLIYISRKLNVVNPYGSQFIKSNVEYLTNMIETLLALGDDDIDNNKGDIDGFLTLHIELRNIISEIAKKIGIKSDIIDKFKYVKKNDKFKSEFVSELDWNWNMAREINADTLGTNIINAIITKYDITNEKDIMTAYEDGLSNYLNHLIMNWMTIDRVDNNKNTLYNITINTNTNKNIIKVLGVGIYDVNKKDKKFRDNYIKIANIYVNEANLIPVVPVVNVQIGQYGAASADYYNSAVLYEKAAINYALGDVMINAIKNYNLAGHKYADAGVLSVRAGRVGRESAILFEKAAINYALADMIVEAKTNYTLAGDNYTASNNAHKASINYALGTSKKWFMKTKEYTFLQLKSPTELYIYAGDKYKEDALAADALAAHAAHAAHAANFQVAITNRNAADLFVKVAINYALGGEMKKTTENYILAGYKYKVAADALVGLAAHIANGNVRAAIRAIADIAINLPNYQNTFLVIANEYAAKLYEKAAINYTLGGEDEQSKENYILAGDKYIVAADALVGLAKIAEDNADNANADNANARGSICIIAGIPIIVAANVAAAVVIAYDYAAKLCEKAAINYALGDDDTKKTTENYKLAGERYIVAADVLADVLVVLSDAADAVDPADPADPARVAAARVAAADAADALVAAADARVATADDAARDADDAARDADNDADAADVIAAAAIAAIAAIAGIRNIVLANAAARDAAAAAAVVIANEHAAKLYEKSAINYALCEDKDTDTERKENYKLAGERYKVAADNLVRLAVAARNAAARASICIIAGIPIPIIVNAANAAAVVVIANERAADLYVKVAINYALGDKDKDTESKANYILAGNKYNAAAVAVVAIADIEIAAGVNAIAAAVNAVHRAAVDAVDAAADAAAAAVAAVVDAVHRDAAAAAVAVDGARGAAAAVAADAVVAAAAVAAAVVAAITKINEAIEAYDKLNNIIINNVSDMVIVNNARTAITNITDLYEKAVINYTFSK